jgi:hypothetical protein
MRLPRNSCYLGNSAEGVLRRRVARCSAPRKQVSPKDRAPARFF